MTEATELETPQSKLVTDLYEKLLSMGGERLDRKRPDDRDAVALLQKGQLFTLPVKKTRGRRSCCHANAAKLWGEGVEKYKLVTGYALLEGVWRTHSWVIDDKRLYETTVVSEKYFGIILESKQALQMWFNDLLPEYCPGAALKLKTLGE